MSVLNVCNHSAEWRKIKNCSWELEKLLTTVYNLKRPCVITVYARRKVRTKWFAQIAQITNCAFYVNISP